MKSKNKFKERWVTEDMNEVQFSDATTCGLAFDHEKSGEKCIRYIEYAAYEQLKAMLAKAKEVLKLSEAALKKVHKHGFSHYEDCEFLEYEEDEDLCDCGSFIYLTICKDTRLKIAEVLKEIGCQDEKK